MNASASLQVGQWRSAMVDSSIPLGNGGISAGYPLLEAGMVELRQQGEHAYSLTDI